MFFFKQRTACELRISDWSSDVGSADLFAAGIYGRRKTNIQPYQSVIVSMHEPRDQTEQRLAMQNRSRETHFLRLPRIDMQGIAHTEIYRKSDGQGQSVSVRLDIAGRRIIKTNITI